MLSHSDFSLMPLRLLAILPRSDPAAPGSGLPRDRRGCSQGSGRDLTVDNDTREIEVLRRGPVWTRVAALEIDFIRPPTPLRRVA